MVESGRKRGRKRVYDAQQTREGILDTAETLFAEYGFDGTSVESIAAQAGYAKSLIFQYFGDKRGLYTQMLMRADRELAVLRRNLLVSLLHDETVTQSRVTFKAALKTLIGVTVDYLLNHPRLVRIVNWERAANWNVIAQLVPQIPTQELELAQAVFDKATCRGWLRSPFSPAIQFLSIPQISMSFVASLSIYQKLLSVEDLSSVEGQARVREYLVDFIVGGIMADPVEAKPEKGTEMQ